MTRYSRESRVIVYTSHRRAGVPEEPTGKWRQTKGCCCLRCLYGPWGANAGSRASGTRMDFSYKELGQA